MDNTPSLALCSSLSRSPSPSLIVQPDHFYKSDAEPSSASLGLGLPGQLLSPDDDPLASRGIPVFKPSLSDFSDFEGYMERVECWGMRSGIVKVIPPKEWYAVLRVNYRKCLVQTCS